MKKLATPMVHIVLALSLVFGLALAAFTQPASAAVTCAVYYIVKTGDTTVSISQNFDLKWRDILKANKLDDEYELEVGDRLCIPASTSTTAPSFTLAARVSAGTVTLTVPKLTKKAGFVVKVRDGLATIGGFSKIGRVKGSKTSSVTASFTLPKTLRSKLYIQVCLKNQTSDELLCKTVLNVP